MSAAYFGYNEPRLNYKRAMYDHVKGRILKAADTYDIRKDVDGVLVKMAEEPEQMGYSLIVADDPRKTYVQWILNNVDHVKQAGDYFNEYRFNYTQAQRKTIATGIMKRASDLNMDLDTLPKAVHADSGYGIPDKVQLVDELLSRAKLSKDAELSIALANIGAMICEIPNIAESTEALTKLAEVINEYDKAAGLDKQVLRGKLLAAEDIVFGTSINKTASALSDAVKINKYIFSLTKLAELDNNIYSNILGDKFVEQIKTEGKVDTIKLANELNKLAIEDKEALEQYIYATYG